MRRADRWILAVVGGVLLGALALKTFEALTVDAALERQKSELTRLSTELQRRAAELEASQRRVNAQADRIRQAVGEAIALTDKMGASQGAAVDRLRKTIAAVRRLRDELAALP